MKHRNTLTLLLLLAAALACTALAQERPQRPPLPEPIVWTEERALERLAELKQYNEDGEYSAVYIGLQGGISEAIKQTGSRLVINEVLGFQQYPKDTWYDCTYGKIIALSTLKDVPEVVDFYVGLVDHEYGGVRLRAASVLLGWGMWDTAIPVIVDLEAYHILHWCTDDRAIPILQEAVVSGSWNGRLKAAAALANAFGDSTYYSQIVLDIINNAPLNTTDRQTNNAKYKAIKAVGKLKLIEAVPGLIRLAYDSDDGVQLEATVLLGAIKRKVGNMGALRGLERIISDHPNPKIRELAKQQLEREE